MISQFAKCRGDVEGKRVDGWMDGWMDGRMDRTHRWNYAVSNRPRNCARSAAAAAASKRDDGAQVLRTCRYYSKSKSTSSFWYGTVRWDEG